MAPPRVLRIAARQSELARLQARVVGAVLRERFPDVQVEFHFRESLGDKNLNDPLWKMPERGVFTEDFNEDLRQGRFDCVVHSWKDLPTEERPDSLIAATLPRADARDLLLVRRDRWDAALSRAELRVFSSSPRRAYNLEPFLRHALPGQWKSIDFLSVRGNIPTRLRKLLAEDAPADALVLAKAAVDRLISTRDTELGDDYSAARGAIHEAFARCRWMVLPLCENPTAAAQGALAIEILRSRADLVQLFQTVNCENTYRAVERERAVLKSYGGGCHQKIGVSSLPVGQSWALSLRGETTSGEVLNEWRLERLSPARSPRAVSWPLEPIKSLLEREELPCSAPEGKAWWVAKAAAVPHAWLPPSDETVIWVAGSASWRELARRGFWVSGSAESLGENPPFLPWMHKLDWVKLSHDSAFAGRHGFALCPTYRLSSRNRDAWPDLSTKRNFYWMSGSLFEAALELFPALLGARHACGPGHTADRLRKILGREPEIYLSREEWLRESVEVV